MWGLDPAVINWIKGYFTFLPLERVLGAWRQMHVMAGYWQPCILYPGNPGLPEGSMDELPTSSRNKGDHLPLNLLPSSPSWHEPRLDAFTVAFCLHHDKHLERPHEQLWELLVPLIQVSFLFHLFALLPFWRAELSEFFFFPLGNELR